MKGKLKFIIPVIVVVIFIGIIIFHNYQVQYKQRLKEAYLCGLEEAPNFDTKIKEKEDYEYFVFISFKQLTEIQKKKESDKSTLRRYFSIDEIEDMEEQYYKILNQQVALSKDEVDKIILLFTNQNYTAEQMENHTKYIGEKLYYRIINQIDRDCPIRVSQNITNTKVNLTFTLKDSIKSKATAKVNIIFFDENGEIINVKEDELVLLSGKYDSYVRDYEISDVDDVEYYFTTWY